MAAMREFLKPLGETIRQTTITDEDLDDLLDNGEVVRVTQQLYTAMEGNDNEEYKSTLAIKLVNLLTDNSPRIPRASLKQQLKLFIEKVVKTSVADVEVDELLNIGEISDINQQLSTALEGDDDELKSTLRKQLVDLLTTNSPSIARTALKQKLKEFIEDIMEISPTDKELKDLLANDAIVDALKDDDVESKSTLEKQLKDLITTNSPSITRRGVEWSRLQNIRLNRQILEYVGRGERSSSSVGLAQAKMPLSPESNYFEIEIVEPGLRCEISIGLARRVYPRNMLPGWDEGSIGYHADDGKIFVGSGVGDLFGPVCSKGDVMGCGVRFPGHNDVQSNSSEQQEVTVKEDAGSSKQEISTHDEGKVIVFFSRNKEIIGRKKIALSQKGLFPKVGMGSCQEKVKVNLKPDLFWCTAMSQSLSR